MLKKFFTDPHLIKFFESESVPLCGLKEMNQSEASLGSALIKRT